MSIDLAPKLFIGCPIWACEAWIGNFYHSSNRRHWLTEYSSVFNTVEGNSTFYGLPDPEVFQAWATETQPGFRFCFKFPRTITHDLQLCDAKRETNEFLSRLEILKANDRLGPTFLQLGPSFSGAYWTHLESYLRSLPSDLGFAVEVRHADYFDQGDFEVRLDDLLAELSMDRVLFDSRALFSRKPADPIEAKSQTRKPRSPFRDTVTGKSPFVRFIGRNDLTLTLPWIEQWGRIIGNWLADGLEPYVFTHSPDDAFAPEFAKRLHAEICKNYPPVKQLPSTPNDRAPKQQNLFGNS